MNDPQTSTANANIPVNPLDSNPQDRLSADQVSKMVEWAKEDLASGKITQAQADAQFAELNVPIEQRGLNPDHRSPEHVALDQSFPAAKPADYIIQYDKPGQAPPMDAVQKQNLQKFDATARTWVSTAGFTREHGNALTTAISRVVETTKEMTEGQIQGYAETEYSKLIAAYGSESALQNKMQLAAKMIHELDAKQPGLKRLLQTRGIGDSALVVSQLIHQAERWEIRKGRS